MKIVSWNMNSWQNTKKNTKKKLDDVIKWKSNCIDYLRSEKNVDFYLLQETNPFKLFEKMPNQYFFTMPDYNILYNELKSELLYDGRSDNFWGNAILFNKNYEVIKNNIEIDVNFPNKNYYGRNAIMCYDFKTPDGEIITITNIYNKINYADKARYTFLQNFKEDIDIQNTIKTDGNFILAGDFNAFLEKEKDLEGFENEFDPLVNCTKNTDYWKTHTYYHTKNKTGIDDFCFTSRNIVIKEINIPSKKWDDKQDKDHRWHGLSDHCPIIVDFDL